MQFTLSANNPHRNLKLGDNAIPEAVRKQVYDIEQIFKENDEIKKDLENKLSDVLTSEIQTLKDEKKETLKSLKQATNALAEIESQIK